MNNQKRIILLTIKKSYAELDWILPVLKELKKNFKIYTFFNSRKSFESLKLAEYLYKEWKICTDKYYIQKKNRSNIREIAYFFFKKNKLLTI